ncbi:MAG: chemotaxis protein CheB [Calditrichaceae bacterium]
MNIKKQYEAIVIGVSTGGMDALREIIMNLNEKFTTPILVVQHLYTQSESFLATYLNKLTHMTVKEADEKEPIELNTVYLAPPNYHLIVEEDKTISLSTDERVNYCRPSIDVLFETATDAYGENLIGIILTGANSDGAMGMLKIKENGGLLIVQDPATAEISTMPLSVIRQTDVDLVLSLKEIAEFLNRLCRKN